MSNRAAVPGDVSADAVDLYGAVARHLPNEPELGGGLISLVEPHAGHEKAYNRYYEDDHYYVGAMSGPWVVSGRRWVATSDLRRQRLQVDVPLFGDPKAGCYLATYFHLRGHETHVRRWGATMMNEMLYPANRGFARRTNVFTAYSSLNFAVSRDPTAPLKALHALDYPFQGLVLEVLVPDRNSDRPATVESLRDSVVPKLLRDSDSPLALAFTPHELPVNPDIPNRMPLPGPDWNLTMLWMLDSPPHQMSDWFSQHAELYSRLGVRLAFAAPFIPTVPGTDRYSDSL